MAQYHTFDESRIQSTLDAARQRYRHVDVQAISATSSISADNGNLSLLAECISVTVEDLAAGRTSAGLRELVEDQAEAARVCLRAARELPVLADLGDVRRVDEEFHSTPSRDSRVAGVCAFAFF